MASKQSYFCRFKILGGGILIVPFNQIKKIIVDSENLRSKVYIEGSTTPTQISNKPEEIFEQTNQVI